MSFPVHFKARLGADPDITFSTNGTAIAKIRVVTNGRRLVDGEWQDTDTSWWQVTAFGKTAEAVADHLHKGDLVMVSGKIKQREWEKDGVKRASADVVADEVAKVVKAGQAQPQAQAAEWGQTAAAPF
jgi:single-strand DNA-binding protein